MKRFLAWLGAQVIYLLGSTLRLTYEDHGGIIHQPDHPPVIVAFWHDRAALILYFSRRLCAGRKFLGFISRSRDGQIITDVASHFGIKAVRGSSSRHGTSAMLSAIRAAGDDKVDLAITPDGPRGPRHVIQPGLIRLAQATGRPIVAVTYDLKWKIRLKSWDRFQVPLPFSRCHLATSARMMVAENAPESELNRIYSQLAEDLGQD